MFSQSVCLFAGLICKHGKAGQTALCGSQTSVICTCVLCFHETSDSFCIFVCVLVDWFGRAV